ncbi:MAG: EamA family transporter [Kiritimatiellae bacterium]|nr:EamA family transporter [Kiritimatiellia bacterium]
MPVIVLALISMACAGGNDFVFKLYARRGGSTGAYLAVIGVVWTLFFAFSLPSPDCLLERATLQWGIISGVFSIMANILFVKSLARGDVGICATIYRLNLVPAALLAFLFFGEPAGAPRLAAIASGAAAVLFFSLPAGEAKTGRFLSGTILVVAAASFLRAGMGLGYKAGLLHGANEYGLGAINGLVWITGGTLCHLLAGRETRKLDRATLAYGGLSGALVCGIILFLMLALKQGDASLVLPVTQMSFVLTALAGITVMKEPLTARKIMGISLGVLCIFLMGIK